MTTVSKSAIKLQQVSFQYAGGNRLVLENVSLSVDWHEVVAVMGRTGSGKTTLLSLLNGLIPGFYEGNLSGNVIVDGMDTQRYRMHELIKSTGFVFQDAEMQILGTTVGKDAVIGPCNLGWPQEEVRESAKEAIASVGLDGMEQRATAYLSGGEKQRVALAGILAMKPRILVLDEPTSELDPGGRGQFFTLLKRLGLMGYTIVIATHERDEVIEFIDRVVVLEAGRISYDGNPRELFSDRTRSVSLGLGIPAIVDLFGSMSDGALGSSNDLPLTVNEAVDRIKIMHDLPGQFADCDKPKEVPCVGETVIEVEDLHHRYESGVVALDGISFGVRQGEFIAIVGKNGAGKTTLSKHLNGLLKPTSGRVVVSGVDTRNVSVAQLSRTVGYVFQNPDHQIFSSSVQEEVEFGLRQYGTISEELIHSRAEKALESVSLRGTENRHPFTLGKGERQKLAVASILALEPRVLVVDEPSTGLDWEGTRRMMDLIHALNRSGHTIIIITHDLQLAAENVQRLMVVSGGRLIADGTPEHILAKSSLLYEASLELPPMAELSLRLKPLGIDRMVVRVEDMRHHLTTLLSSKSDVDRICPP